MTRRPLFVTFSILALSLAAADAGAQTLAETEAEASGTGAAEDERTVTIDPAAAAPRADAPVGEPPPPGEGPTPYAQPTLVSFNESARLAAPRVLEGEFAYRASIAGARRLGRDATLHTGDVLLGYALEDMEFRLGWHMFGVASYSQYSSDVGVGHPWFTGKFAIRGLAEAQHPHQLSIVATLEPGIGQSPVRVPGLTGSARAAYTIRFNQVELDANAGLAFNTADAPSFLSLPLGARVVWLAQPWLDVFGEFVQALHFTDLRASETLLAGGCSFRLLDGFDASLTGGVGLSTSLPAGFIQAAFTFHMGSPNLQMSDP